MRVNRLSDWSRLLDECEESLANDLWIAAIRSVARFRLLSSTALPSDDEEAEEMVESLLRRWKDDAFHSVRSTLLDMIGEYDYFVGITEPWYEIFSFTGSPCGWPTSDIIYSLELAYPQLEGEITDEMVEDVYDEWVSHFLSIVIREASHVEA